MADAPFDVARAHRWFAVELNNVSWDLVEKAERSAEELERMIHAAHGACFHWLHAGNLLNHQRAQNLLATAYVRARLTESAVRHAERCLQLSAEAGETQTTFDRATAHGCAAAAFALAGRKETAKQQETLARTAAEKFDDADDRRVFENLYPKLPD